MVQECINKFGFATPETLSLYRNLSEEVAPQRGGWDYFQVL